MDEEERINQSINQSIGEYHRALVKLSCREGQVLELVADGKTIAEIAEKFHLSVRTVENHRYNICKKIGLKGKGALDKWLRKHRNKTIK